MTEQMAHIVYLIAGVLFIFSLAGLAKQETARTGNFCGIIGMAIAILVAMAMANACSSSSGTRHGSSGHCPATRWPGCGSRSTVT